MVGLPKSMITPVTPIPGFPEAMWGSNYLLVGLPAETAMSMDSEWRPMRGWVTDSVYDGYLNNLYSYRSRVMPSGVTINDMTDVCYAHNHWRMLAFTMWISSLNYVKQVGVLWCLPSAERGFSGLEFDMPTSKPQFIYMIEHAMHTYGDPLVYEYRLLSIEAYSSTKLGELSRERGILPWDGSIASNGETIFQAVMASRGTPPVLECKGSGPGNTFAYDVSDQSLLQVTSPISLLGQTRTLSSVARDAPVLLAGWPST